MTDITQNELDKAEGVVSTDQIAKNVPNTDEIVQADGDFIFLKMGGMVAVSQATIAALKAGLTSGTGSVAIATSSAVGTVKGGSNVAIAADGTLTTSNATTAAAGAVKQAADQSAVGASSATDVATLLTDFNAFATKYNATLAALKTAGIMA